MALESTVSDGALAGLTVAVATLDRPEALSRCLDALLSGAVRPAEIIVVDQSADDAARAVVTRHAPRGVQVRYYRQDRRGLSASRNAAIMLATQPILAVTDDDCVPDARWVATIVRTLSEAQAPDAVTGRVLPLGAEEPGSYAVSSRVAEQRVDHRGRALPWSVGTGANLAVVRKWLAGVGGYDERFGVGSAGAAGEDTDLLYRLLRAGAQIRYEPDAIVYHERQSYGRRLATRSSYGRGIGACCAAWLRRGDPQALVLFGRWLASRVRRMVGAAARRDTTAVYEELLVLSGTVAGVIYGATLSPTMMPQRRDGLARRLRRLVRPAWLGTLRRTRPLSDRWGSDRGTPLDRYYIERFLADHRTDIRGRVLEVKDEGYTARFGAAVETRDVLDVDSRNPRATVIADLAAADAIPSDGYDCVILTQVLQLIFDTRSAIAHAHRILKPGGVLLVTVPTLSRIVESGDYWRFTPMACRTLFAAAFGADRVEVRSYGNVLSAIAFLAGMAWEELSRRELDVQDDDHPLLVAVRAVKG
ncbi:MAG: glycosyltransferase [Deltaproteobacteria bacterium]|nr:glycosyltransferase [Deltaproteobacteria bacterium]